MNGRKDGGPAFPGPGERFITGPDGTVGPQSLWGMQGEEGMSLLDWYAAHAPITLGQVASNLGLGGMWLIDAAMWERVARLHTARCREWAAAMIEAREQDLK